MKLRHMLPLLAALAGCQPMTSRPGSTAAGSNATPPAGAVREMKPPPPPPAPLYVSAAAFSPDGRFALTGYATRPSGDTSKAGNLRQLTLWEVATGKELWAVQGGKDIAPVSWPSGVGIFSIAFFPDGKTALLANGDRGLLLWDVLAGKAGRALTGERQEENAAVTCVAVAPDGKLALSGDEGGRVRLWEMPGGKLVRSLDGERQGAARSVTFSPDGKWAFAVLTPTLTGDTAEVWEVASGAKVRSSRKGTWEYPLAFSPDGRFAVADRWDGDIKEKAYLVLWEVASGKEVRKFDKRQGGEIVAHGESLAACFTPDAKHVLSGDSDLMLRAWDVETGKQAGAVPVPAGTTAWAFSRDARLALTAGGEEPVDRSDNGIQLQLWDAADRKLMRRFSRRFVNEP